MEKVVPLHKSNIYDRAKYELRKKFQEQLLINTTSEHESLSKRMNANFLGLKEESKIEEYDVFRIKKGLAELVAVIQQAETEKKGAIEKQANIIYINDNDRKVYIKRLESVIAGLKPQTINCSGKFIEDVNWMIDHR